MDPTELIILTKALFVAGGIVMPPLVLCILLLWYGLGYRFWVMKEPRSMGVRDMLKYYQEHNEKPAKNIVARAVKQGLAFKNKGVKNLRRHLDAAFYEYEREIGKFSVLIHVVILISPLLGLLGTVIGMIETFDSLATMTLHSQSGGIAGGISQALFTTQMGLTVAIPGLLAHSILIRKQRQIEQDLSQVKDLLCHQATKSNEK
ncbi:MAG: MotA/TolQ/ExbB proton channel family protein [Nitrosomonas sp.]|uniref:MotA/TolQ/ExbB proton channel family protein n=1 Tax=Nitrosomonas sp. TaxID=42353 RepID=UPI0027312B70|nr:MotA/TolQ/ExbB proton channel family protein [Nitrosomonas sp.]MDP1548726.1 MotA/TolQ/ExbB proton channel family protein [Nitrosomonas sp.]MDP1933767.1 MotA/TolQ/ExbB proton channel family protein [Nitrosomonas sp.]